MVKNTRGGKKAKKMKNSGPVQRATIYPDEEQYYAIVEKFHSHSNIDVYFVDRDEDGKECLKMALGVIRGCLIKRLKKIDKGDIFIISKREFETVKPNSKPKVDIIHKYFPHETQHIMSRLPIILRNCISLDTKKKTGSGNSSSDSNDEDEDIFNREYKQEQKKRVRINNCPKGNIITNDYLKGFDLPSSDDGFTTDEEPFEGTDEDYQNKLIDSI